jgi:hypothetical protein
MRRRLVHLCLGMRTIQRVVLDTESCFMIGGVCVDVGGAEVVVGGFF